MRRSLRLWLAPNKQAGDCDVHRCVCIVSLLWQDKWQTSNISYEKCFSPQDWTEILRNHHKPVLWQVAFHQTPNVIYFISLSEGWQGWGARLSDESPLHTTNRSFQNVCVLVRVFTVIFPKYAHIQFYFYVHHFHYCASTDLPFDLQGSNHHNRTGVGAKFEPQAFRNDRCIVLNRILVSLSSFWLHVERGDVWRCACCIKLAHLHISPSAPVWEVLLGFFTLHF